jgi:hypothetical protein
MVIGDYREFFVVVASSAATLIGLLFVAMSVAKARAQAPPPAIQEFRSAAALLAFTNPFTVALFGLIPGSNMGYPAAIVGIIGGLFTAAGVRTIVASPAHRRHRRSQLPLILGLIVLFGFQTLFGIELVINEKRVGAVSDIGDVLVASLLIGIGRAWELVGDWDTGIASSIRRLIGHQPSS